jgi:hypothetical protein
MPAKEPIQTVTDHHTNVRVEVHGAGRRVEICMTDFRTNDCGVIIGRAYITPEDALRFALALGEAAHRAG